MKPETPKPTEHLGHCNYWPNPIGSPGCICLKKPMLGNSPHDWPEDFSDENGNYQCRCMKCQTFFIGYKRRVVCKVCDTAAKKDLPKAESISDCVMNLVDRLGSEAADVDPKAWEHLSVYMPKASNFGIIDPDYARIYTQARIVAWQYGYSCCIQGSFTRDLDILLTPWTDRATRGLDDVVARIADVTGTKINGEPSQRPHGRKSWTLLLPGFTEVRWVDVSAFEPPEKAPEIPEGYKTVLIKDAAAGDEPDWDAVRTQVETATGIEVERNNYSLIIREVRRWLAQKATELPSPGRIVAWQAQWSNGGSWKGTGAPQRTEAEARTLLENSKAMTKRVVPLVTLTPEPTALEKYRELEVDKDNLSPLENLRMFCSLAMRGQDWLDVERFFTALSEEKPATDTLPLKADPLRAEVERNAGYWTSFIRAVATRGASLECIQYTSGTKYPRVRWVATVGSSTATRISPESAFSAALIIAHDGEVPESFNLPKSTATKLVPSSQSVECIMDVSLDEDQAGKLRDMLGDRPEDAMPIRLTLGQGHSGYGLYASADEYPDEGAILLKPMEAPNA